MEMTNPLLHRIAARGDFMVGSYEIMQGADKVGTAVVTREGLYYRISCRCRYGGEPMRRILMTAAGYQLDLGVCVPVDGQFGLEKRIPCKNLVAGTPEFRLMPKYQRTDRRFVPVYPEEPFSYMAKLKDAFLEIREGQIGVLIKE